jgi:hypothetical protein
MFLRQESVMKRERLDQILERMGFVTRDDIKRALKHKEMHGGRLGSALVYLGLVSEAELIHALCAQHDVPGFFLDEQRISAPTVKRLPYQTAEKYEILAFAFHRPSKTVSVAAIDPGDKTMIAAVKKAYRAKAVDLYVASESLLRLLINHYYRGQGKNAVKIPKGTGDVSRSNNSGFWGGLAALGFIDLLQVLAQASKSIRMNLSGPQGEKAEVYLRRGRMVHAKCGPAAGVDAVYRIIGWGEDGTFEVLPTEDFPSDNVFEANEAILMEGCRLMDEAEYSLAAAE